MMLMMDTKISTDERIVIAHGGGGEMTQRLVAERILPKLGNPLLSPLTDSAVLPIHTKHIVFTTDAFVVQPLEFPGGDIGKLAVPPTLITRVIDPRVLGLHVSALGSLYLYPIDAELGSTLELVFDGMNLSFQVGFVRGYRRRSPFMNEQRLRLLAR
jgi:hypothetical protein